MYRSEQAKTYAAGRPEPQWEARAPNPVGPARNFLVGSNGANKKMG